MDLPEAVRNKARAAGATWWVDRLPTLIASLEADWGISVGDQYQGGTEAFVARATDTDGRQAVLKLLMPRVGVMVHNEIDFLARTDGNGCPDLYRYDHDRGALLMEQLGPSLFDVEVPIHIRHAVLCDAAAAIWRPAADSGFRTGAAKGRWLGEVITTKWQALDRPCSERAVDHALSCAERRVAAHDDERSRLVHGDVHQWNALQAGDTYKLVDPDGLLAEPEYDLGIIMREDPLDTITSTDPHERARFLATRTALDPTAIWEWGVVERVSTGLIATEIDLQPVGAQMLAAADQLAAGHYS